MILTYECDSCEDIERMEDEEFFKGMHCECGGHLFLQRYNNYEKGREQTKCMTCKHNPASSIECTDCTFNALACG